MRAEAVAEVDAPSPESDAGFDKGKIGSSRWWIIVSLLMLAASATTTGALFPAYYKGGEAVADTAPGIWLNVPAIVVWAVSGILLLIRRVRLVGAGMVAASTVIWSTAYISEVGEVINGTAGLGLGILLDLAGLGLAASGAIIVIVLLVIAGGRPSASARGAWWSFAASFLGIAYAIGMAMDWSQATVRATAAGDWAFNATGTAELQRRCCSLSDLGGWGLAEFVAQTCGAILILLIAAAWRPARASVGALLGAGFIIIASPLAAIIEASKTVTATDLGYGSAEIREGGLLVVDHGALPGLWVTAIAAAVILVLGAVRAINLSAHTRPR